MLPRVIIHNEVSVDGRMDWLAVDMGLYYELASRWEADAILCGSNTILIGYGEVDIAEEDEEAFEPPQRDPHDPRPQMVIVDSRGRIDFWHQLRREPYWRDPVALCSHTTPKSYLDYLERRHIDCIVTGDEHVDLRAALGELNARYRVELVRVDSGGTLNGLLLRAGLVDEISVLVSPSLVGGRTPRSIFTAPDLISPEGVIGLRLIHIEQFEAGIVWLRYEVVK